MKNFLLEYWYVFAFIGVILFGGMLWVWHEIRNAVEVDAFGNFVKTSKEEKL